MSSRRDGVPTSGGGRRGFGSMVLAVAFLAGMALFAYSPAQAGAADTGSISGTISDNSGEPPLNACVRAYDSNGTLAQSSLAHPPGQFKVDGLAPGDYRLKFSGSCSLRQVNNVLDEFYDDQGTLANAILVSVQADSDTPGIHAHLSPGGSISGKVTDSSNNPVRYVCVKAYDSEGTLVRTGDTAADGTYSMVGLFAGNHRIEFEQCGYRNNVVGEFYDNGETLAQATTIPVAEGSDTPNVNAELGTGGTISGMVTNSAGDGQRGIQVEAFDSNGNVAGSFTTTNTDGSYQIVGLADGDYRLEFSLRSTSANLLGEFYKDKATLSEATPVSVTEGSDTPDIDTELDKGGSISGKMIWSAGGGTAGFARAFSTVCLQTVSVFDSSGNSAGSSVFASAADGGSYRFERLRTGDYRVFFHIGCGSGDPETGIITGAGSASEYYKDKKTLATATPVPVVAGLDTPNIDGVVGGPDGSISGTVTNSMGDPLGGICVKATRPNANGGSARTDLNGQYKIPGLADADYQIGFEPCSDSEHNVLGEFYDDAETAAGATLVSVTDESDTAGIDAELAKGGSISGVISIADDPLGYFCVLAYDSTGTKVRSGHSESDGSYTIVGLPTGSYRLRFHDCFDNYGQTILPEYFDDVAKLSEATPIQVTAGSDTPNIDARLALAGSISGTVTDSTGDPIAGICMWAYDSDGTQLSSFRTNSAGNYTIAGLVTGSYRVKFSDCTGLGFTAEFYANEETLATATPVSVVTGSDTPGIDAQLVSTPPPDHKAPDTRIDSGPSGTITADEATFTFSSTDADATSTFQCRIDSGEFLSCTSPKSFSSLTEGAHTFAVRATDAAGNLDGTPAIRTFKVDTTVRKARISKVSVKGPARVKKGSKATFRVRITNSGNARATGVGLKVRGRGVNVTRRAGAIAAGATRTVRVKLKPKKRGRTKLRFSLTSANAGGKSVSSRITVTK
ncbi:MAG: carboxypeptidase regulatory-like domain-containing protein [Solirubrobacterales bacterium]